MYDTIIVGAGIAGMSAAIYASRKRMNYRIISSNIGGQFLVSGEILNYPGIIKTSGADFSSIMEEQLKENGVNVSLETVKEVKRHGLGFRVISDKSEYDTKTVIIATGARARKLGVPGEERLSNKGVAYCSICDGPLFSGVEVAVVGGGNAALEAADFMKDIASKIYLLVKGGGFTGHEYLQESVNSNPKVEVLFNARTTGILGENFVEGLKYEQDGSEKTLSVGGVIIEVGRAPNTDVFDGFLELDEHRHVKIDCQGRTSVPGVFAAGDCASGHEYQYVIAAGQGVMALIKAARYLASMRQEAVQ